MFIFNKIVLMIETTPNETLKQTNPNNFNVTLGKIQNTFC